MSLALAFVMLLEVVQFWWLSFDWYAQRGELRVVEFLPNLVVLLLIYLLAAAVLPDEVPAQGLDLRQFYKETAGYFWSLVLVLTAAIIVILGPGKAGTNDVLAIALNQRVNLGIVAACILLLCVRNIRVHQAAIVSFVGFISWLYLSGVRTID